MDNGNEIILESLYIETTRRCNMRCDHCLRGDAQNADIDLQHIDDLLDQVELVGSLFITGGEPTLNLEAMAYIADSLSLHGIPICTFGTCINGLIYSERFIEIVKRFKYMVDFSRDSCFPRFSKNRILDSIPPCVIGISIDRFHEQPDLCLKHCEMYKDALSEYADVRIMKNGNAVENYGRAKNLKEKTLNVDYRDFMKHQRIEVLSKDITPACKYYNTFETSTYDKTVCCGLYMNVYGNIISSHYGMHEYDQSDTAPIICKASEPLWESILKYNKDKIPCPKCQQLAHEKHMNDISKEDITIILDESAQSEEPQIVQKIREDYQKKEYDCLHPKSIFEALVNVSNAYKKWKEAMDLLNFLHMNDNKTPEDIIRDASNFSYFYNGNLSKYKNKKE